MTAVVTAASTKPFTADFPIASLGHATLAAAGGVGHVADVTPSRTALACVSESPEGLKTANVSLLEPSNRYFSYSAAITIFVRNPKICYVQVIFSNKHVSISVLMTLFPLLGSTTTKGQFIKPIFIVILIASNIGHDYREKRKRRSA